MEAGDMGGELPGIKREVGRARPLVARLPRPSRWRSIIESPTVVPMTQTQKRRRLRPLLSGVLLRTQTDERLTALAGTGNQQAFSAIYERYRRELGSHASRIVRPDRTDDVVQHAMLAAWSALLAGTEISDLRAWLHRVTHNAALDTINRRGYYDSDIPDSSIAPSRTEELAEERLSATSALAALAALPETQRRALTLTAIEGRSGRDAALEMGISENAMRQLVYRARSSMRSVVTAVTPLPLIDWLVTAAGASSTPAAISLGVAGGGGATIVKAVAVIGVTAATLGATHAVPSPHQSRHARHVLTTQPPTTAADGGGPPVSLRVSAVGVSAPPASATNNAIEQLAGKEPRHRRERDQSQQGSASSVGDQSGPGSAAGGGGDRHSATQQRSGAGQKHDVTSSSEGERQSGTQQQADITRRSGITSSGTDSGSQQQQSGQANTGSESGPSGASPTSAPQTSQSGNADE
jgi:RNA polymerase sigma factor (sigma-70 family)